MCLLTKIKVSKETQDTIETLSVDHLKILLKHPNQRSKSGFREYKLMTLLINQVCR